MTPLSLVLAGAADSAAADFGDQDPRGLTHTVIGSLVVRGEQARHLEQFVTVGLRAARLFPSSPVTRRRFWGSGRSRSRVSAGRGRRPGRFRRRSPPPCFPRSGGRGRGTGGRARAPCGGNCSPAIRAKIRPEPVREPLSPPGGLSRPEPGSERVGQDRSRMPTANLPLAPLPQTPSANCIFSLAGSMPTAEIRGLARWTRHGAGRHSRNRYHR